LRVEAIIQSMTPWERANPDAISLSRKKRLAKGCGQNIDQINLFMKNFGQMRQMMHQVSKMPAGKMGMPPGAGGMGLPAPKAGIGKFRR